MPDNSNPNNATPGSSSSAELAAEKPKRARSIIRKVQGKAKQKYATRNKPLLKDYLRRSRQAGKSCNWLPTANGQPATRPTPVSARNSVCR